ncbi:hypothetical protein FH609_005265 [Streptomyces sp. 3MP-14]|uniref:WXG100 family type VII secretion target n=1 Tax=Streptomyces mimosae TaxID=2586635 RepID=A0A5N6AQ13_9ACTN|nr:MULTISPECIES: hypothetical protein [Streptomyces]KAB8169708.1 hypothetical protein FH607_002945 [Streptomyces mimosae]KAB8178456.1 hypothetical protein FH609_005265 [Streptomyces sp. 3MP-14]
MADISADYAGIAETAGKLSTQCNIIVPEIYSLLSRVGTLLDDGLYLEQASPALKTAYEEFSKSMHMAASNIQNWANLFTGLNDAFQNNDAELFAATLSSIDGEGGLELTAEEVTTDTEDPPEWGPPNGDLGGTPVTWNEDRSAITQG